MSSPVKRQSEPARLTLRQHLDAYLDNLLLQGRVKRASPPVMNGCHRSSTGVRNRA